MALKGLYEEAVADGEPTLLKILEEYEAALKDNPTNTVSQLNVMVS
jgi:hypothetical protein